MNCILLSVWSLAKLFKNVIVAVLIVTRNFNLAIHYKYKVACLISCLMYEITPLVNSLLHKKLNFEEEFLILHFQTFFEIVDLF